MSAETPPVSAGIDRRYRFSFLDRENGKKKKKADT
jgi:hypothetical protein